MSKLDLFSTHEIAEATSQGWLPVEVYDPIKKRLGWQILPPQFTAPTRNTEAAFRRAFELARAGSPLALKALRAISQGHPNETRHRRPK